MSEQYKGYELNTAGDKNWADREVNLHKAQIDADVAIDSRLDVAESEINSLQSYTVPFSLPSNGVLNLHELMYSHPRIASFSIRGSLGITNRYMVKNFNKGDIIDNTWVFAPSVTADIEYYKGERCMHLHIPAGNSGIVAEYPMGTFTGITENYMPPYLLNDRVGIPLTTPHAGCGVGHGVFKTPGLIASQACSFGAPFSELTDYASNWYDNGGPETFSYCIRLNGVASAAMDIYISYVKVTDNNESTYIYSVNQTSTYYITGNISNNVVNVKEQLVTGKFNTNMPVISGASTFDSFRITTVNAMEGEISLHVDSIYDISSVVAGTGISIDKTDPTKPIIASTIGPRDTKGSIRYKLQSTAGVECQYTPFNAIKHGTIKLVATPTGTPIVSLDFSNASHLNDWTFGNGVTSRITEYNMERVLHLHVPAGFSGQIARRELSGQFAYDPTLPNTLYNTYAVIATDVSDIVLFGVRSNSKPSYITYTQSTPENHAFYSTIHPFTTTQIPEMQYVSYRIETKNTLNGAVDIYLSDVCVKINDANRRGVDDLSSYYLVMDYVDGTRTTTTTSATGCFIGNEPTLGTNTITHSTENMSLEIVSDVILIEGVYDIFITGIDMSTYTFTAMEPVQLTPIFNDSIVHACVWESSDEAVCTVDANGLITPLINGVSSISVTYNAVTYTCACSVEVIPALPLIIEVTTISDNQTVTINNMAGVNKQINWGNAITTESNDSFSHVYETAGVYTITMEGKYNGELMYETPICTDVTNVISWGNQITNASYMFYNCGLLTTIPTSWTGLDNVTNTYYMFGGCALLASIPTSWTGLNNVTNTSNMFLGCSLLASIPTSWTELNNVTNVSNMFGSTSLASIPASWSGLNNVTDASYMFSSTSLVSIPASWTGLDNVTNTYYMFGGCTLLTTIPTSWTGLNCVAGIFGGCSSLSVIPTTWTGLSSNITSTAGMFSNCTSLQNIPSTWEGLSNVTSTSGMFMNCVLLTTIPVDTWTGLTSVNDTNSMFTGTSLASIPTWEGLDNVTNTIGMFSNCVLLTSIPSTWTGLNAVNDTANMFDGCTALASIPTSWTGLDTVTSAYGMFQGCSTLASIPTSWTELVNVSDAHNMFAGCIALTTIPVSWSGLSNLIDSTNMFMGTSVASIPDAWTGLSSISTVNYMFSGSSLTSITSWTGLSTLTSTAYMFNNCALLTTIPASWSGLTNVTDTSYMFDGCSSLTSIPSWASFGNVVNTQHMFSGCTLLNSIPNTWDGLYSINTASEMFTNCTTLTTIPTVYTGLVTLTSSYGMFRGCSSITTDIYNFYVYMNTKTPATLYHDAMFRGCTNATGYSSVSSGWK